MALAHFRADGSFTVEFRECVKPQTTDHVDTGHYTYDGSRLRMTTETQNGFWTMNIDDYLTSKNDGHMWVYKSVAGPGFRDFGQVTFHDVRVTPTSKMPECDLSS